MARGKSLQELGIKDSSFLETARKRWKAADDADDKQSTREQEDLAFYDDQQWPADILRMRGPQPAADGMPAALGRPTLVINKVREPVRQVQNEIRASDIGIELVPADDFGDLGITLDDTEITLREGLIRRIQRESEAQEARNWAGDRATIAGRGYYLVMTRYMPGKTWDQEIYVHRIYNQAGVKLDPAHEQPDGSDADWGFIGTWMPWDKFQSLYPKLADGKPNPFSDAGEAEFLSMNERYPDWYNAENDRKAIRIVDYWYTEREARELAILSDGSYVWTDELKKTGRGKDASYVLPRGVSVVDTRTVIDASIKFCKIAGGILVLEETDWLGPDLPIIKVLGEEIQPYDEERRAEGMVRPARGAQRAYNYMISKLVETVGLTPIPPLQVDPDAIEGYKTWYQNANIRPLPYLPYRSYDDQQRQLAPPMRPNVDPNLQPMAVALSVFDQSIKSTTAVPDPTLGNVDPSLKSGKAIKEVVANAKQSTSNFLDNRIRSTRREGTIINNLLYPVYGARPGRLVRILTGEGEQQQFAIGDPQDQALKSRAAQVARLTEDAHFNVIVKVTKEFESRRQQEAAALAELITMNPEFMGWFGDLYFLNSDIPGRRQLAERVKAMLAPPILQMEQAKQSGQAALPPAVQAEMQAMKQQLAMADAAIKELEGDLKGKQLDAQTKIQTETISARTELEKARMDNATKLRVAEIQAETKGVIDANRMEHEAIALAHQTEHSETEAQRSRDHERVMETTRMAHDAATSDAQADRTAREGERNREASAVENARNRAMKPKGKA